MKRSIPFVMIVIGMMTSLAQADLLNRLQEGASPESVEAAVLDTGGDHYYGMGGSGYHEPWMGGCCRRAPSCCDHWWNGYCASKWSRGCFLKYHSFRPIWYRPIFSGLGGCGPCGCGGGSCCHPRGCVLGGKLLGGWKPFQFVSGLFSKSHSCIEYQDCAEDCNCGNAVSYDVEHGASDQWNTEQVIPAPQAEETPPGPPQLDESAEVLRYLPGDA